MEAALSSVYRSMAASEPGLHLPRQLVHPIGIGAPQIGDETDLSGHGPLRRAAEGGPGGHRRSAVPPSGPGRSAMDATWSATSPRTRAMPEVGKDGHPPPGQVDGSQSRLPSVDPGQAQRIALVESVARVEVAGRVPHRAAQATDDRGHRLQAGPRSLGDPPIGGLQSEETGESGRYADRSSTVAAGGQGQQPAGHGGGGTSRRTAGGAGLVPRVAGRPVQLGRRAVDTAELTGRRLGRQHGPGGPQSCHRRGVVVGHPVLEQHGGIGGGPALDPLELLHPDGHTPERQRHIRVRWPRHAPVRSRCG